MTEDLQEEGQPEGWSSKLESKSGSVNFMEKEKIKIGAGNLNSK